MVADSRKYQGKGRLIYIKTFGCSLNQSDSELMAGLLNDAGFEVITDESLLDASTIKKIKLVLINTCTVKNLAENKFWHELEKWLRLNKKMVVSGCIPQAEPELLKTRLKDISVIGTRQLTDIINAVNQTLKGKIIHNLSCDTASASNLRLNSPRLNLPKLRKNKIIEIIPICEGCLGNCTYCKTKFARGNLISYPKEQIIQQAKTAIKEGCKELWITSQDNGCYGMDIYQREDYFLPQLLKDILNLDGNFRVRLGMCNPNHIMKFEKELIEVFKHKKMFRFLHIPVQSGNDRILKLMNRFYSVKDFETVVKDFRKEIPDITICTDVIVGFPEETEKEFNDSVNLFRRTKPDAVNISRFWLRKGTNAEKLPQVHGNISKIRSELMKKEFDRISLDNNKQYFDKYANKMNKSRNAMSVLIDDFGKHDVLIGRAANYKQIIIRNQDTKEHNKLTQKFIGKFVKVKIIGYGTYDLKAEIIE